MTKMAKLNKEQASMNQAQISYIEIPFHIKWLNPNFLMAWTHLAKHDYIWILDCSVSLKQFIKDIVQELKEDFDLTESDHVSLRIRDKSDWRDELGLRKLTADVLNGNTMKQGDKEC